MTDPDNILSRQLAYYTSRVPWHDQLMSYRGRAGSEALYRPIIARIEPLIAEKSMLEVAAGTGTWTEIVATRAAEVLATDAVPSALDLAATKVADLQNVELKEADAYDLRSLNRTFDCVFGAYWYSHIPLARLAAFWEETAAVLKPGGTAIFLDMTCKPSLKKEIAGYDADGNCLSRRVLPDGSEHTIIKNFPTAADIDRAAGQWFHPMEFEKFEELKTWLTVALRR